MSYETCQGAKVPRCQGARGAGCQGAGCVQGSSPCPHHTTSSRAIAWQHAAPDTHPHARPVAACLHRRGGATNEYAAIRSFQAAQLRFARSRAGTTAKYWLAGLRYIPLTKPNQDTDGYHRPEDIALLIGQGWKETFANGTRVLRELAFAGGGGFMAYVTIGVQVGARPTPPGVALRGFRDGGGH